MKSKEINYKENKELKEKGFIQPKEFLEIMTEQHLIEQKKTYEKVLEIAEEIKKEDGQALLVGGSVRDFLMGKISKDFDIEVYGLEANKIEEIVKKIGNVSDVGKSFGILKIFIEDGVDIDVSLPRKDSKIGVGHRGFEVKTDPHMSIEDAARRRDFTMNSVAADPLTGELYDPFNGAEDIKNRILKVTDKERFKDDPLRVLRGIQFVGRFGLEIEKETSEIMKEMTLELKELPKERIGEEWKKLLLKSEKPSLGLSAGMMLGVFREVHPQFPPLAETKQDKKWHPEGDVWIHTLMVVDKAADIIRREGLEEQKALTIMLTSLCHDLGKPATTEFVNDHIRSLGHAKAGIEPTKKFLTKMGISNEVRKKVVRLVKEHLTPTTFYIDSHLNNQNISNGTIRRLAKRIHPATIQELVLISEADHLGRGPYSEKRRENMLLDPNKYLPAKWLLQIARKLEVEKSKPVDLTRGRDWMNFGFEGGPDIGRLIRLSNELRDDFDFSKEIVLRIARNCKKSEEAVQILEKKIEDLKKDKK